MHVRRSGDDYAEVFAGMLPTGPAWPRDVDSVLMKTVSGLMETWGLVDGRIDDLLTRESDPRATMEMLPDWEEAFGLPDPCVAEPLNLIDRHKALIARMTAEGGQSIAFFQAVAQSLGYTVVIQEYSPFMCGVSRCGDTRPVAPANPTDIRYRWEVGPAENRYYWRVHVLGTKTRWFRAGSGQVGVDPMVRIGLATDLECLFRRWKPGQTEIVFDYSNATPSSVSYNWFRVGTSHVGVDTMLEITTTRGLADS